MEPKLQNYVRKSSPNSHRYCYFLPPFTMPALTSSTAIGITAAVIIAATGGTSLLAETAVPGDALYTVKTNVNESVRGSLAFSTSAEVESESDVTVEAEENIDAAQTLITEIRMLTAQSIKTSAEVKADITAKLSDATVKLNDARTEFSTKAYAEAKALAEQAAKIGAEAELMLKNTFNARSDDDASVESESSVGTESNVKIEVESNVDVQSENNVGVDL